MKRMSYLQISRSAVLAERARPGFFCAGWAAFVLALSVAGGSALGGESQTVGMSDPDLPQEVSANVAEGLLGNSPFIRTLEAAETYELTGVAYIEGKPVVTIRNRQTKQRFVVSDKNRPDGWALLEVSPKDDLSMTTVRLAINDEIIAFHFTEDQLAPEDARKQAKTAVRTAPQAPRGPQGPPPPQQPSVHLTDATREQFRALPDEAKQRYRQIMEQTKDRASTPDQRAAFKTHMIESLSKSVQSGSFH